MKTIYAKKGEILEVEGVKYEITETGLLSVLDSSILRDNTGLRVDMFVKDGEEV